MSDDDEFFGTPGKIALMKRSRNLWLLLQDNPRFAYYGRAVALSEPGQDTAEILAALAKLQGAAVCYFYPASAAAGLYAELLAHGLSTDRHEHFRGGSAALEAGTGQEEFALPEDLTVTVIDANTPRNMVSDVAGLLQSCDVMPVPGSVMRGQRQQGISLVAVDRNGRPVATASSYAPHHPSSTHATDVFWGMLATREDRRGERIALLLGAQAINSAYVGTSRRTRFHDRRRADNPSSRALCEKLGVERNGVDLRFLHGQGTVWRCLRHKIAQQAARPGHVRE